MATAPIIPETAPFSPEQRAWLNGFLAGLFSRTPAAPMAAPAAGRALSPLTICFGSQTGTAEALAKRAAKEAGKRGFAPTVMDLAQLDLAKLAAEKNVLIIASTYGDGEPPDNAKGLHRSLLAANGPIFAGVRFSVCSLGDRNYTQFCKCGQDFDTCLEKLGAARASPRVDCDLDYDEPYAKWLDGALSALGQGATAAVAGDAGVATAANGVEPIERESGYTKKNPFPAPVVAVRRLSGASSQKDVNHIEFSLEDSGLAYEAGDALGVWPQNCPELVEAVLTALHCDGEEAVPTPAGELPLRVALLKHYELGKPTAELLAMTSGQAVAAHGAGGGGRPEGELLDVLDVLHAHAGRAWTPGDFVRALRKMQPRLYSIASSPKAHAGRVHLTVGAVRFAMQGRARKGICSTFLAERAAAAGRVGVYLHANAAFKLPKDGARPIIMVGPGTGIAPFRAFIHERQAAGATGRNWLFFGDQRAAHDFLYRDELETLRSGGALHRMDTAFSRDQAEKIYVQNRMKEMGRELFRWLEEGAYFYVCGDAKRMARDVEGALLEVIQAEGGLGAEAAADYLNRLRMEKRYARDVY